MARLEEVCEILDSKRVPITAKDRVVGPYPYYGANGVQDYVADYIFDDELVLLAEDGGHFGSADKPIAYRVSGKCWVNNHAHVLKAKECIDIDYLCYSLMFRDVSDIVNGATRQKLTQADMRKIEIPLLPIEEQKSVVAKISKVFELIALRKEQLAKLDRLVKSRFIELFGDPIANPMGWEKVNITAVVGGKVSNGFFAKRDDYCDDGNVKVLGVAHVVNRMYSNIEDLPTTNGTETDVAKYSVKYGDMLFCRSSLVAAGIGKASVVPQGTPNNVLFECHVIRLPLDLDKCVPEFMQVLSTTEYFRNQVIAQSKTATMTTIGQDGILKTDIILPPLEMQKQFLQFVEQTEKSKLAIQQSHDKLELLKKSLMQEYFG